MANVETERAAVERPRKLSVADTLAQATQALQTHRAWMRKRISTVSPVESSPKREKTTTWGRVDPEKSSETVDSPTFPQTDENSQLNKVDLQRAPPPFELQLGGGAARQWRGFLKQKRNFARVSPSEALGALPEVEETPESRKPVQTAWENTPDIASGGGDTLSLQVSKIDTNGDSNEDPSNSTVEDFQVPEDASIPKRKRLSKASVVPIDADYERTPTSSSVSREQSIFTTSSLPPYLPPALASMQAWGSLTSLDNYMESLKEHPKEATSKGKSPDSTLATDTEDHYTATDGTSAAERLGIVARSAGLKQEHVSTNTMQYHKPEHYDTDILPTIDIPPSLHIPPVNQHSTDFSQNNTDNSMVQEDAFATSFEHLQDLQSASAATIVPVSPAPKEQRSSYALHKQSKLSSAEEGLELISVSHEGRAPQPTTPQSTRLPSGTTGEGRKVAQAHKVPEAILQPVLPAKRSRRTGASMIISTSAMPILQSQRLPNTGEMPSTNGEASRRENYTSNTGEAPSTNGEASRRENYTSNAPATELEDSEVLMETSEGNTDRALRDLHLPPLREPEETLEGNADRALRDLSLPPLREPEETLEGNTDRALRDLHLPPLREPEETLEGNADRALRDLSLPPLREPEIIIDGSEMVKQLPPLKLQSPSTSSLLDLTHKRRRAPPSYSIHRPQGGLALAPPCPLFGMEQPLESEVLKEISRRRSSQDFSVFSSPLPSPPPSRRSSGTSISRHSSQGDVKQTVQSGQAGHQSRQSSQGDLKSSAALGGSTPASRTPSQSSLQGGQSSQGDLKSSAALGGSTPASRTPSQSSLQGGQSRKTSTDPESRPAQLLSTERGVSSPSTLSPPTPNPPTSPPISQMPTGPGPLHLAAKSGNLRRLQSLINQGHDVDMPDHEGKTPLTYCIHSKGVHLSCADALIREGANLNKQASDGSTAIHLAAFVGAVSLIELMLLNGANPDIKDFDGRLPIHWGTTPHSPKSIDVLIKHSDLDLNMADDAGMTPLMWAAYNRNPTVIGYLLDRGADLEEKDTDGYTAMHWAVHKEGPQCLQLLLKPDMTYFKDHRGRTVMHHASETGSMEACELILKMRPDAIYDTDKMGRTPLHYAAACSRVNVCALLLDRGCDASQKDISGKTPLEYARIKRLDYVVALLTCHSTAVADFARASRSTSVASFLNRSTSFSQLPLSLPSDTTSVVSESLGVLSGSHEEDSTGSHASEISGHEGALRGDVEQVVKGAYLGQFIHNSPDPVQHFCFWLKAECGTLCWARETNRRSPKETLVLGVHEGPSNAVRQAPSYSPNDLHQYAFWVETASGVLDLLAYNEDAYTVWVRELEKLARANAREMENQQRSRPASRQSFSSLQAPSHSEGESTANLTGDRNSTEGNPNATPVQKGWTENAIILKTNESSLHSEQATSEKALGAGSSFNKALNELRSLPFTRRTQIQPLTSTPLRNNDIAASRVYTNPAVVSMEIPDTDSFADDVI